jgi:CelD/BcsL family acetyltransferase involved in cellulose biosynthesis
MHWDVAIQMNFHASHRLASVAVGEYLNVAIAPDFDFGSNEFSLFQAESRTTAFQAPRWLDALHRQVAPAFAADAVTVTAREKATGRLVLVLPLIRVRRGGVTALEFADFGLSDYAAAIYRPDDAQLLLADVTLPERIKALLPASDVISLSKLADLDPVLEHLFANARWARMRVSSYAVPTEGAWCAWRVSNIHDSVRRELDLKRRRLGRAGKPSFVAVQDESEIARTFDALRAFRAERFKQRGACDILDNEVVFSFYRTIAIEGAKTGAARTFCLYLSGEPIAVMFGLVQSGVFSLLLVGFDLARYRRLSVGLLAIEETLRSAVEEDIDVYDFTIGDYPFKTQFGARPSPLYECHAARTIRGWLAVYRVELVREAKRTFKPLVRTMRRSRLVTTAGRLLSRRKAA